MATLAYTLCGLVLAIPGLSAQTAVDYTTLQLATFNATTDGPIGTLTTGNGAPVEIREAQSTLDTDLIENAHLLDVMTHFSRERIPERVVHARGAGCFGYFEVTHDITKYTKAKFLDTVGKRTPIVGRFGPAVASERGSSELVRDPRGYAIKFYTEEGNWDMVGFNSPMFFSTEPLEFFSFVHAFKRDPVTNYRDMNSVFDVVSKYPHGFYFVLYVLSDRGIPATLRNMDGYSIHTYDLENATGDVTFVRFHFLTDQGLANLNASAAAAIQATDPDYHTRDLYNAIAAGDYPSWTAYIQTMTEDDVANAPFDPFNLIYTWPTDQYPLQPFGKIVLNRNPSNYFADVEQLAFNPGNLVPGILGARDRAFQSRRLAYLDTQNYRLDGNHKQLPVNKPLDSVLNYLRDGAATIYSQGGAPNYYENSFNGPVPYVDNTRRSKSVIGELVAHETQNKNIYAQATVLYNSFADDEKDRTAFNFAAFAAQASLEMTLRLVPIAFQVSPDLVLRVLLKLPAAYLAQIQPEISQFLASVENVATDVVETINSQVLARVENVATDVVETINSQVSSVISLLG